jgi:hypothetical protein
VQQLQDNLTCNTDELSDMTSLLNIEQCGHGHKTLMAMFALVQLDSDFNIRASNTSFDLHGPLDAPKTMLAETVDPTQWIWYLGTPSPIQEAVTSLGMNMKCIQHICLPSNAWHSDDTISYQTAISALKMPPQQCIPVTLVNWVIINMQASWTETENNVIHSLILLAGQHSVQAIILFNNNLTLSDQLDVEWKDDLMWKTKWLQVTNAVCGGFMEDSQHIWVAAPYQVIEAIPDWPLLTTYDYALATVLDLDSNADTLKKCDFFTFRDSGTEVGTAPIVQHFSKLLMLGSAWADHGQCLSDI